MRQTSEISDCQAQQSHSLAKLRCATSSSSAGMRSLTEISLSGCNFVSCAPVLGTPQRTWPRVPITFLNESHNQFKGGQLCAVHWGRQQAHALPV